MIKPVTVISTNGASFCGEFILQEISPADENLVRLQLVVSGESFVADGESFFEALTAIRDSLEQKGLRPKCQGAREDVYPSPMILNMGLGEKAYRLTLGQQAKMADLVEIFEAAPETAPASVSDQEAYYRKWLNSLG